MNIVSYDTSKIDNYPENCEELGNKWYNENYTEFKILVYLLIQNGNKFTFEQIYSCINSTNENYLTACVN